MQDNGKTTAVDLTVIISWLVSAVAAVSMAFGAWILNDLRDSIEENQAFMRQTQQLILDHMLKHPDIQLDRRVTRLETKVFPTQGG